MRAAAVIAIAAALGCAARPEPIDRGELSATEYRNAALDLRVAAPPGWVFVTGKELSAFAHSAYAGDPATLRKIDEQTAGMLFVMVERSSPTVPGRAARSVLAYADAVPEPAGQLTSELVAGELANVLSSSQPKMKLFVRRQAIVADRRFVVVATEVEQNGIRARMDYYVRYETGRVLGLTFSYLPEDSAPPQIAIEAIRPLDAKGKP